MPMNAMYRGPGELPAIIPVLLPPPVSARSVVPPAAGEGALVSATTAAPLVLGVAVGVSDGAGDDVSLGVADEDGVAGFEGLAVGSGGIRNAGIQKAGI